MKQRPFLTSAVLAGLWLIFMPGLCAALEHSGVISADETWLAADNPHEITANLTVNDRITLTLEPGVEVLFKGNFGIYVSGLIQAQGTSVSRIRFTRAPGVERHQGIYLYTGAGGILAYCTIEWASYGINAYSCYLSVANSTIQNNTYGIYASSFNPELSDNIFENNQYGLRIDNYYAPSAKEGTVPRAGTNNVFRENGTGIYFYDCLRPSVAATAQIYDNTDYGVHFQNCGKPAMAATISNSGTGVYYQNCTDIQPLENLSLYDNNGQYGAIFAQGSGAVPLGSGVLIEDNYVPLTIDSASFATAASLLPAAANFADGILVFYGSSQQEATWYNFGIPYIVIGTSTVTAGGSLAIEQGVRVRLGPGGTLSAYGAMDIKGKPGQEVRFGPNQAARWNALAYYAGSSGSVTGAVMEFANYGLYVETSSPEVDGCRFLNNTNGYYGNSQADSTIQNSLFAGNDYGIRVRSNSNPVISQNSLERNYNYAVLNETTNSSIDAENNFWGDPTGPKSASNPNGLGDPVSPWVDFDPWLAASPL